MPITISFGPFDRDYIERLNQLIAEHNASTDEVLAVGEALAGQVAHVDEAVIAANEARDVAATKAGLAGDSATAADQARVIAVAKAALAGDSATAADQAKVIAVAAKVAAAGYAAETQGVMGVVAGEIRGFSGPTPPAGWALCQGQVLNIIDHPALWAVLGAGYGGDGVSTFALPIIDSYYPRGARVATIEAGDVFTAHLPGPVDATYTALVGDGVNQVAAGLEAAITASAGYAEQAFSVAVVADVITLTAKVAGTGFDVTVTTATAPGLTVVTANDVDVVQVVEITISGIKCMPWPATHRLIYLG